ncbi:MAG TPA: hypothetical protein VFC41_10375, partial [Anaerovoracaceae bacterium]|nr:hypothetical protein [Anaerovoracaceae bacterium]
MATTALVNVVIVDLGDGIVQPVQRYRIDCGINITLCRDGGFKHNVWNLVNSCSAMLHKHESVLVVVSYANPFYPMSE